MKYPTPLLVLLVDNPAMHKRHTKVHNAEDICHEHHKMWAMTANTVHILHT